MPITYILHLVAVVLPMSVGGVVAVVVGLMTQRPGLVALGVVLALMGGLAYLKQRGHRGEGHDV